jgi:amino acid transporter
MITKLYLYFSIFVWYILAIVFSIYFLVKFDSIYTFISTLLLTATLPVAKYGFLPQDELEKRMGEIPRAAITGIVITVMLLMLSMFNRLYFYGIWPFAILAISQMYPEKIYK